MRQNRPYSAWATETSVCTTNCQSDSHDTLLADVSVFV